MDLSLVIPLGAFALLALASLFASFFIVRQYEKGVVFRFGKLTDHLGRGPGLRLRIPLVDRVQIVDLRTEALELKPQEVITKDNVTAKIVAGVYFKVHNPIDAATKVDDYRHATLLKAQTVLRNILGQHMLDELLQNQDKIAEALKLALEHVASAWGIDIESVEIKDIELPENMRRAMAQEAEADRERRAKIIAADGELQASVKLAEAATAMSAAPGAMHLRSLQTLHAVGIENNTLVIFPMEMVPATQTIAQQLAKKG